jgi:hypothetical protein
MEDPEYLMGKRYG